MISETAVRTALVELIRSNDAKARVHRRVRYPKQNRIEDFKLLYLDEDKLINCYMVRRVRRTPVVKDSIPPRLVAVEYEYQIRFRFGLVDNHHDAIASEETAQARVASLPAVLEADNRLGLGA